MGSLFSGSGGFELAAHLEGITPIWNSEVEPFPILVTRKNLSHVKYLGNIKKIDGRKIEPVDIITFGSPCFPKGTLILTDKGHISIENIKVGMKVLTHKGRFKKVIDIGWKLADTIKLKGNHYGLECTPNHPIYSKKKEEYEWISAENMLNKKWGTPRAFEQLAIPVPLPISKRFKPMPEINEDLFYFVGRWIGDGWVRNQIRKDRKNGQRFSTIFLCDSIDKKNELINCVSKISENYSLEHCENTVKIKMNGRLLCDWLVENFGKYAHGKQIAPWAFSMPKSYRKALLKGLCDSDGYEFKENCFRITSISKKLVHDIRLLAETLNYSTSIFKVNTKKEQCICGRKVHQKDYYTICLFPKLNNSETIQSWYKVKQIKEGRKNQVVYNLTVEDDNSYVADSIVVHNCQDLSIAGKRQGLAGKRSNLFYEAIRIIKEMREETYGKYPRYIIWENVPGAFSSNKGEDFRCVLETICQIKENKASILRPNKWTNSGEIMGGTFSLAWRVLDARYFGVPQRRRRIFLVADFSGGSAGEILFDKESMSGDIETRTDARKTTATNVRTCTTICLNDHGGERMDVTNEYTPTLRAKGNRAPYVFENHGQDSRFNGPLDISPTLGAQLGLGGNNQPLVVNTKTYDIRLTSENTKNVRANVYETHTSRTIDTGGNNPDRNQGGLAVVYSTSKNSHHTIANENEVGTLVASDYKDPPIVNERNLKVRRLTPMECGRLQGFPDDWCKDLAIENPSEEELVFWRAVFEEQRFITGKIKSKSDKQIIKWLANPYSDTSQYKMWGNGVALPCVRYIMKKISEIANK